LGQIQFNPSSVTIRDTNKEMSEGQPALQTISNLANSTNLTSADLKETKDAKDAKSDAKDAKPDAKEAKPDVKEAKPDAKEAKPDAKEGKPDAKEGKEKTIAGEKTLATPSAPSLIEASVATRMVEDARKQLKTDHDNQLLQLHNAFALVLSYRLHNQQCVPEAKRMLQDSERSAIQFVVMLYADRAPAMAVSLIRQASPLIPQNWMSKDLLNYGALAYNHNRNPKDALGTTTVFLLFTANFY
jgi:hypothetical protein